MAKEQTSNDSGLSRPLMWLMGLAVTVLTLGFGSLESRKVDKSAFDLHLDNECKRFERIDDQLDRMDGKLDQLLLREKDGS